MGRGAACVCICLENKRLYIKSQMALVQALNKSKKKPKNFSEDYSTTDIGGYYIIKYLSGRSYPLLSV